MASVTWHSGPVGRSPHRWPAAVSGAATCPAAARFPTLRKPLEVDGDRWITAYSHIRARHRATEVRTFFDPAPNRVW